MKKQSIDSEKIKTFLKKLKGVICKGAIIIFIAVFTLLLIAGVPLIINGLFEKPAKCDIFAVNWNVEDALSYYAAVLGFVGTVSLGAVAVFQTDRANKQTDQANKIAEKANEQTDRANKLAKEALVQTQKANELASQMQKLEQAKFISMISLDKLMVHRVGADRSVNYHNSVMPELEMIDMMDTEYLPCSSWYLVDIRFENESEYPIVQVWAHATGRYRDGAVKYGIKDAEASIYIPPASQGAIRFIIPTTAFDKYAPEDKTLWIDVIFTNVFDYQTHAIINIDDITRTSRINYTYRLQKMQV